MCFNILQTVFIYQSQNTRCVSYCVNFFHGRICHTIMTCFSVEGNVWWLFSVYNYVLCAAYCTVLYCIGVSRNLIMCNRLKYWCSVKYIVFFGCIYSTYWEYFAICEKQNLQCVSIHAEFLQTLLWLFKT